jgi:hypothetical protein
LSAFRRLQIQSNGCGDDRQIHVEAEMTFRNLPSDRLTNGVFFDGPRYLPFTGWAVVVFNDQALLASVSAFDRLVFPSDVLGVENACDRRVDVAMFVLVFSD